VLTMLRIVWRGPTPSEEPMPVASGRPNAPIEALGSGMAEAAR